MALRLTHSTMEAEPVARRRYTMQKARNAGFLLLENAQRSPVTGYPAADASATELAVGADDGEVGKVQAGMVIGRVRDFQPAQIELL